MKFFYLLLALLPFGMIRACSSCNCASGCCTPSNKEIIKQEYGKIAENTDSCCPGGCCGGGADLSQYLGYTQEELESIPEANLGLGCGHPVSLGKIKAGDTILDLGSGAGIDCFLAAKKVGATGKVIGVDMTEAMIEKARENAANYDITNVEFRLGYIENLPVETNSVDIVISNCVINLSDDKFKVFQEAHRVLKSGGKMYVSDVILLDHLTEEQKNDAELLCACVSGALLRADYLEKLNCAGFDVKIIEEDVDICEKWFGHTDLPIASLKFIAYKK